jgi:hypothetical protein
MRGKGILHSTGIHKQVVDPKKVRKKVQPFAPKKGEIGGLAFFSTFISLWKKQVIAKCSPVGTKRTYVVLAKTRKKGGGEGEL